MEGIWSCKNDCDWGGKGIPLCVACTIEVLGKGEKHIPAASLVQDGQVCAAAPGAGGDVIGEICSFDGFSCLADGKPLKAGQTPPCPKCGNPIFWVEPTKPKPKVKVVKVAKLVTPTSQDLKAAAYIHKYMESHGYPPTIREIMVACEYPSSSSAFRGRERLVASGLIKVVKGAARGIKSVDTLTVAAATAKHPPSWMPMYSLKTLMASWAKAVGDGVVVSSESEGGIFVVVPDGGGNVIRWFKSTEEAVAFKKSMLD